MTTSDVELPGVTVVEPRRHPSEPIATLQGQASPILDADSYPHMDHRASCARAVDLPAHLRCTGCGAALDEEPPLHHRRCRA